MAKTAKHALVNDFGCGFISAIFQLKGFRSRNAAALFPNRQLENSKSAKSQSVQTKRAHPKPSNLGNIQDKPTKPLVAAARNSTSSSNNLGSNKAKTTLGATNGALCRASSGNVVVLGRLGNLKHKGCKASKTVLADVGRKTVESRHLYQLGNIFQSPTNRSDPDVVKSLGNNKYKEGKYEEALALYDQAIAIDPNKACLYCNKSAALMGLGRLLEAVVQCKKAIRIDTSYHNAHYRLANLYLRLGVAEKAVYHYKRAGGKARDEDIGRAKALKNCLVRCVEASGQGEWAKLLDGIGIASSLGADAAPQIYTMKAEALVKVHRHEEAYAVIEDSPYFTTEFYANFLGSSSTPHLLQVQALVYMANGRFEDAVSRVEEALQLHSSSTMVLCAAEIVKYVAWARTNGNKLFKDSRYSEALIYYNKGLEKDPYNSVLLCNRAACRSKLGHYEKAVEDCNAALLLRPSYTKPRLRRAHCNAKLEKWEAAVKDYQVLKQEMAGDEEVNAALLEAKAQLNK